MVAYFSFSWAQLKFSQAIFGLQATYGDLLLDFYIVLPGVHYKVLQKCQESYMKTSTNSVLFFQYDDIVKKKSFIPLDVLIYTKQNLLTKILI